MSTTTITPENPITVSAPTTPVKRGRYIIPEHVHRRTKSLPTPSITEQTKLDDHLNRFDQFWESISYVTSHSGISSRARSAVSSSHPTPSTSAVSSPETALRCPAAPIGPCSRIARRLFPNPLSQ